MVDYEESGEVKRAFAEAHPQVSVRLRYRDQVIVLEARSPDPGVLDRIPTEFEGVRVEKVCAGPNKGPAI